MGAVKELYSHSEMRKMKSDNMRIALAGNPNCGKTTVFNGYTGSRQHVGNYPGVTVDRKEGELTFEGQSIILVDLPGTYSLTAYSQEELVARRELALSNIQSVIDIVDSSALERNLLLTVQMLEMGIPLVLACNMMDEAESAGINIDMPRLGNLLGVPVVPMIAKKDEGLEKALSEAIIVGKAGHRSPLRISYGPDLDTALLELEKIIEKSGLLENIYPSRFVAIKLLENDQDMFHEIRRVNPEISANLEAICNKASKHIRETFNASPESVITDHR